MPKNRPGPAGARKLCHMWLKRLETKIAALAMITQHWQTYSSHVDFDSFTVFMCLFRSKKTLKGSLQPKLKGASVWPFNTRSKVPTG